MKRVWQELLKRKRVNYKSTKAFKYPATCPKNWSRTARALRRRAQSLRAKSDPSHEHEAKKLELSARLYQFAELNAWERLSRQELALLVFFDQTLEIFRSNSKPVSRVEAQAKRERYLDMAKRIRNDVEQLDSTDRRLIDAVFAYEELANQAAPSFGDPLLVERRKRNVNERQSGFVIELASTTTEIFGSPLYGIVAIVTNVVFACEDWNAQSVRKIAKHTPPLISRIRAP